MVIDVIFNKPLPESDTKPLERVRSIEMVNEVRVSLPVVISKMAVDSV